MDLYLSAPKRAGEALAFAHDVGGNLGRVGSDDRMGRQDQIAQDQPGERVARLLQEAQSSRDLFSVLVTSYEEERNGSEDLLLIGGPGGAMKDRPTQAAHGLIPPRGRRASLVIE